MRESVHRVVEGGPETWSPEEVTHLRLTQVGRAADHLGVGERFKVSLLCEQFGAVVEGSVSTVSIEDRAYVTCEDCLEAPHA